MPRSARIIPTNSAMHIMCRGNNKLAILANEQDKKEYYYLIHKLKFENNIDILHYCFMDNHVHLIIWLNDKSDLPRLMKQISLAYYYYYKRKYNYCGHLWQGRFKSIIVQTDLQALTCGKYIELNPVRAGTVISPEQFKFSSYKFYALGYPDGLLTPNPAFAGLDANTAICRKIYANFIKPEGTYSFKSQRKEKGTFPF